MKNFTLLLSFLLLIGCKVAINEQAPTPDVPMAPMPPVVIDETVVMPSDALLPFGEIPPAPDAYTTGAVMARQVEGLGYRYYWATEGLRAHDLTFKPSEDARSTGETIDHLYGLSSTIINAVKKLPNMRPANEPERNPAQLRAATLQNLAEAVAILRASDQADFDNYKVIFKRGENESSFPYWNMINGPIADAIYHCGQVASFRRTSGNPMNPKVNVFLGSLPQ